MKKKTPLKINKIYRRANQQKEKRKTQQNTARLSLNCSPMHETGEKVTFTFTMREVKPCKD